MNTATSGSSFYDENPLQVDITFIFLVFAPPCACILAHTFLFKAMATPAKQTLGPKRAFGDDITNSSKKDLKGLRTPMQQASFTPRQSSAGDCLQIACSSSLLAVSDECPFRHGVVPKERIQNSSFFLESTAISSPRRRTCN